MDLLETFMGSFQTNVTEQTNTCSKLTIKKLEKGVTSVQS